MAVLTYREGSSPITVQEFQVNKPPTGQVTDLWNVPQGFFGRWRVVQWILDLNTADATFRGWFINVVSPALGDMGQIIPGQAAVGGGSAPTTSPIHEMLDATSPVFFDSVFQGAAGVKPEWDYSGMSAVWYPPGYKFQIDASQLVAGDAFRYIKGLVELIEGEPADNAIQAALSEKAAIPWLLHTP